MKNLSPRLPYLHQISFSNQDANAERFFGIGVGGVTEDEARARYSIAVKGRDGVSGAAASSRTSSSTVDGLHRS
jgi:hypothetical protein